MNEAQVIIIMGSAADKAHAQAVVDGLRRFGIQSVTRVASAHKSARHLLALLEEYEREQRPRVYVTIAGRSNALSGMVDANVTAPVIACPPPSDAYGGADVFSSLRMPGGVAAAVVLEPANAALAAAKMLALADPAVSGRIVAYQAGLLEEIIASDTAAN